MSLAGKTLFVTGASRGIGLAIALRAARDGANIVIAAKTDAPHPKLRGTIHTAAAELEAAGGQALPLVVDVRDEAAIANAVERAVERFGGIDVCVNNASAMHRSASLETSAKQFDLMHQINARGTFLVSKACLPHLLKAQNPHILVLSPPLDMQGKWFGPHVAYTMSKFGMSMCALGLAEEYRGRIAVNALWPHTPVATAAIEFNSGGAERLKLCRKPSVMADAAYAILTKPAATYTGHFLIDDLVLAEEGVRDFSIYDNVVGADLALDLFVDAATPLPAGARIGGRQG